MQVIETGGKLESSSQTRARLRDRKLLTVKSLQLGILAHRDDILRKRRSRWTEGHHREGRRASAYENQIRINPRTHYCDSAPAVRLNSVLEMYIVQLSADGYQSGFGQTDGVRRLRFVGL